MSDEFNFTGRRPFYNGGANEKPSRPKVPKTAFDMEYSTQTYREYAYLKEHGFEPTFIKVTPEYGIKTYKYTKTPALFKLLAVYYEMVKNEKEFENLNSIVEKKGTPIDASKESELVDALIEHGAPLHKVKIYA